MSAQDTSLDTQPELGLRRAGLAGLIGSFVLIAVLGGWAATTAISSAVVASGQAIVRDKPQIVQSLDGGLVSDIHVKSGDIVSKDTLLMRLDPTLLEVNLGISRNRLAAALPLQARLRAEQAGLAAPVFDYPDLPVAIPDTTETAAREAAIFVTRAEMMQGKKAQLVETLNQLDNQRTGLEGQIAAINAQIGYVDKDLDNLHKLSAQGLTRSSDVSQTRRTRAQLAGELARLEADLAHTATAGRDAKLELRQTERAFQEAVITELRDVTAEVDKLTLEIVTHSAQLKRIDIRAPSDGIVHEMQVSTKGGVVAPGATIMQVIPLARGIDFEVRVDPQSVDQVHPGQSADLVLSSYDPQTVPKLRGEVTSISADKVTDPQTGQEFYRVGLAVSPAELARTGDAALIPGMPVEAYLHTGERTVLAYLVHPITTHLRRAFRE